MRHVMRLPRRSLPLLALVVLASCSSTTTHNNTAPKPTSTSSSAPTIDISPGNVSSTSQGTVDIYAADRPNALSPVVAHDRPLIYVPNSLSNTVDEIDPRTGAIVRHFAVGRLPQHVVPAWDLKTLYVTNDLGNSLTPIDPVDGTPGAPIPVADPYNMYFTPDGKYAIVVAERLQRLDFRDPHSFKLEHSLAVGCAGVDHIDFSADGRYLIASCEFAGRVLKVDLTTQSVVGMIPLGAGASKPQDVKLDPTGHVFYVADMLRGGVYTVDGDTFRVTGFIRTGAGAHGLYVSRDSKYLYVTNRGAGTVSLLDFTTNHIVQTWRIPGGGSPDMGGISADGTRLWISGRYNSTVYEFDTATGAVVRRVAVGSGPHGLCVYPQPGRYSLGHTGIFR
jgi:YVTN family beta-propeller protein